jgi:DNA-directed RNA polymerase subunit L
MEVSVLKKEKNHVEVEMGSLTLAELIRDMLWQDKATTLAAWKREHPSKKPLLILKTEGKDAMKVLMDTIDKIQKINEEMISEFKKAFKGK